MMATLVAGGAVGKTILLVEDEEMLMALMMEYLQEQGYTVVPASCGAEALHVIEARPELDLLISDFRLPGGMNGVDIAQRAVNAMPGLKVVFVTGNPAEVAASPLAVARVSPVLGKPFALDRFQALVERQLH